MSKRLLRFNGHLIDIESKSIQKSVRFRQSIYDYIMAFPGKNFSDKLENLVIEYENRSLPL